MNDLLSFERSISAALDELRCDTDTVVDLRRDTRKCRDEVYADAIRHGGDVATPFVNFIITNDVAIFTFFESNFSVYVVPCDEHELISQTKSLAMTDVEDHRQLLTEFYGKRGPDAVIPRTQAELWLG